MMYKKSVSGFVAAMEMALENPRADQEEQHAVMDQVFEKLDQPQRTRFFGDVSIYVRESGLMKRWPSEKLQAARKLFGDYKTQKFIELEEKKEKAA